MCCYYLNHTEYANNNELFFIQIKKLQLNTQDFNQCDNDERYNNII